MHEMLVGRRPFMVPARHWLNTPEGAESSPSVKSMTQGSERNRDRLSIQFFEQHCKPHLCILSRGGDELDEFDLVTEPVSAAAWSLLTERLLAPTEGGRLPTTDGLKEARGCTFLCSIDWEALEAHCLPPVDMDRTVGHLHELGGQEGLEEEALSAEQQRLFESF